MSGGEGQVVLGSSFCLILPGPGLFKSVGGGRGVGISFCLILPGPGLFKSVGEGRSVGISFCLILQEPRFPIPYVMVYFMFNDMR
jgi:hypothetical protein